MPHDEKKPYIPLTEERYQRSGFPYGSGNVTPGYIPESNVPVVSPERRQAVLEAAERERVHREFMARQAADPRWSSFQPGTGLSVQPSPEDWAIAMRKIELEERGHADRHPYGWGASRADLGQFDDTVRTYGDQVVPTIPTTQYSTAPTLPPDVVPEIPPQGLLPEVGYSVDAASPLGPADFRPDLGILGEAPPPEGWEEHLRMKNRTGMDVYREALAGTKPPLEGSRGFLGFLEKNKELLGALAGFGMTFRGGPWAGSGVVQGMKDIREGVVEDRKFKLEQQKEARAEAARITSIVQEDKKLKMSKKTLELNIKRYNHAMEMADLTRKDKEEDRLKESIGNYVFLQSAKGLPEPTLENMRVEFPGMSLDDATLKGLMAKSHFTGRQAAMTEANNQLALIVKMSEVLAVGDGEIGDLPGIKDLLPDKEAMRFVKRRALEIKKKGDLEELAAVIEVATSIIKSVPKGATLVNMMPDLDFINQVPEQHRPVFESLIKGYETGLPAEGQYLHFPQNKVEGESEKDFNDNLFVQIDKLYSVVHEGVPPESYGLQSKEQAQALWEARVSKLKDRTNSQDQSTLRSVLGNAQLHDPTLVFPDASLWEHFPDAVADQKEDWRPTEQHYINYFSKAEPIIKGWDPRLHARLFNPKYGGIPLPYGGGSWKEIESKENLFFKFLASIVPTSRNKPLSDKSAGPAPLALPGAYLFEGIQGELSGLNPNEKRTLIEEVLRETPDLSETEIEALTRAITQ